MTMARVGVQTTSLLRVHVLSSGVERRELPRAEEVLREPIDKCVGQDAKGTTHKVKYTGPLTSDGNRTNRTHAITEPQR
eukprot:6487253-Amphidinium_carterae.1